MWHGAVSPFYDLCSFWPVTNAVFKSYICSFINRFEYIVTLQFKEIYYRGLTFGWFDNSSDFIIFWLCMHKNGWFFIEQDTMILTISLFGMGWNGGIYTIASIPTMTIVLSNVDFSLSMCRNGSISTSGPKSNITMFPHRRQFHVKGL